MSGSLKRYRDRRDFSKTREPRGRAPKRGEGHHWVIQEHAATSHHFDFRLEVGGVLRSWAVPKGPSTDPRDKRLAVPTEDHPLDYLNFEGVIPEGEYGAGAVIVWDTGTYTNLTTDDDGEEKPMDRALADGHAAFRLDGEKISGGYALTRMGSGDDAHWLLVKMDDEEADARRNPTSTERASVLSGKTIEDVAREADRDGEDPE